jgi:single-stranded DNA-binding protein
MSANISLIGNLGKEPETKITDNGTFIANFSIASNTFRMIELKRRCERSRWSVTF